MTRVSKAIEHGGHILSKADQKEYDRLIKAAAASRADGCRLDAWAYEQCAKDIIDRYKGIRYCQECGKRKR